MEAKYLNLTIDQCMKYIGMLLTHNGRTEMKGLKEFTLYSIKITFNVLLNY